jgi:hypothetical protein
MKHRFQFWLQSCLDNLLCDSIRHSGDSQRELHINTVSPWAGLRSSILSTHFAAKASRY